VEILHHGIGQEEFDKLLQGMIERCIALKILP